MTSTQKNGEESMSEILASIRQQAAERAERLDRESRSKALAQADHAANAVTGRASAAAFADAETVAALVRSADWASDLPAILRPGASSTNRPNRTTGTRLSDALRVVKSQEDAAERLAAVAAAHTPGMPVIRAPEPEYPRLSAPPSRSPSDIEQSQPQQPLPSQVPEEEPRRVMVSFLDTRMSRMGQQPAAAKESFSSQAAAPAPEQERAPVAPRERPSMASIGQQTAAPPPPPSSPVADPLAGDGSQAREGAAELLRPVLRQWLADNMPRIVERALHMELAEGVKKDDRSKS